MKHLHENLMPIRVLMGACTLLFVWASLATWLDHGPREVVTPAGFALLGVLFLLNVGSIEINEQAIIHTPWIGRYQIRWDEVQSIEMDAQAGQIGFEGENKRLVTLGPQSWLNRWEMLQFIYTQAERRQIEIRQTTWVLLKISKNTKVRHL